MISVCIATYNGERFIKRQVDSILCQLDLHDEVIISDDGSTDKTVEILKAYNDSRIKVFHGGFHSPVLNFENAIRHAHGDVIFLSDQDDEWRSGRVVGAMHLHADGVDLVMVNRRNHFDDRIVILDQDDPFKKSMISNVFKPPFVGATLSISRRLIEYALPFPKGVAMHDLWIGLIAMKRFKCAYLPLPLVEYNRHGESFIATHPRSLWSKIGYRIKIIVQVYHRLRSRKVE